MKIKKLKKYINEKRTILGIGPMSKNVIDASIAISDKYNTPIILVASRRQIDDKNINCGYVNNWSTEDFAAYVKQTQKSKNILIARDHGGPWQNNIEIQKKLSLKDAMKSAKDSYQKDIDCGFDFIHIDPSIDIYQQISFETIFERLTELYEFCSTYATTTNKQIEFEVGTEEQMIHLNAQVEFKKIIEEINNFCSINNFKIPFFTVTQIGTKVMEMKNIGILSQENNEKLKKEIKTLCNICLANNSHIKVHNTDYLPVNILKEFPKLKISAANVAPEFGVCETKSLIELLETNYLFSISNEILELAYNSKKWDKWLIQGSRISNRDKAIISGHYIFASDNFKELKEKAQKRIKNIDIDIYLKQKIKERILKYLYCFNIIENKQESICTP